MKVYSLQQNIYIHIQIHIAANLCLAGVAFLATQARHTLFILVVCYTVVGGSRIRRTDLGYSGT